MTRRTTLTVTDDVLEEAQRVLGTTGVQDTVDRALADVIRRQRLRDLADRMRAGEAFDFPADSLIDRDAQWRTSA